LPALPERKTKFNLLFAVFPQHGDSLGQYGDGAPSACRLRRLYPQARLCFLKRTLDAQHLTVEINVRPLQREQLAPPHAGRQCETSNGEKHVPLESLKDGRNFLGCQDINLTLFSRRRLPQRGDILGERLVFNCPLTMPSTR
jgi:hypothetical protein